MKFLLIVYFLSQFVRFSIQEPKDDVGKNSIELIKKYGYTFEQHFITTSDGYIICVHRIPNGRVGSEVVPRNPVMLVHGLIGSTEVWLNYGNKSMGFILADKGYDVWMPNARGNVWSRNHTNYNPTFDPRFWNFSWHEIGYYDWKAVIDFILSHTKKKKLYYIGHSQGGTTMLVLTTMRPEYNKKIALLIGLAPAAFVQFTTSSLLKGIAKVLDKTKLINTLISLPVPFEILPTSFLNTLAGTVVCAPHSFTVAACQSILYLAFGHSTQVDKEMLPVIFSTTPAGSSTKQYLHYGQGILSNDFRQYDYGYLGNLKEYRKLTPPSYDLSKIKAPLAIIAATDDTLSSLQDLKKLRNGLKKKTLVFYKEIPNYGHMDVLWAHDVVTEVVDEVLDLLSQYPLA